MLSDLAAEVIRYIETGPLLETVAHRISDTLHVPGIVILLRDGDAFRTRYSTRPGERVEIGASERLVQLLREREAPLEIYFDRPPEWLRSLASADLETLRFMRTQLLLPLPGHKELLGLVSLGLKLSELPYSDTDKRLLEAVAVQMGLALENSRFSATLAAEAAQRERIRREMEIARKVRERLFPQQWPSAPGWARLRRILPPRSRRGRRLLRLPPACRRTHWHCRRGRFGKGNRGGAAYGESSGILARPDRGRSSRPFSADAQRQPAGLRGVDQQPLGNFFLRRVRSWRTRLSYVNAGHNPPGLLRGSETIRLEGGGPVVGLFPKACYD